jgi:hypothetical protein
MTVDELFRAYDDGVLTVDEQQCAALHAESCVHRVRRRTRKAPGPRWRAGCCHPCRERTTILAVPEDSREPAENSS